MGSAGEGTLFRLQLAGIAVGSVLLAILLSGLQFWETLESRTLDLRFTLFPAVYEADSSIIIVVVDGGSLERMSWLSWPWPRQIYSACLSYLQDLGARVVAFDILYDLPSVYDATEDDSFGETASMSNTVFVMGLQRRQGYPIPDNAILDVQGETAFLDSAWTCTPPWHTIAGGATLLGSSSDRQDPDGIFRSVRLLTRTPVGTVPSLPLAVAWLAAGRPRITISQDRLMMGDTETRLVQNGRLQLRFHGPAGSYRTLPIAELLSCLEASEMGEEPPLDTSIFRDAVVLFGYADPALYDLKPTPYSPLCPGVEVLATAIDNILSGESIHRASRWQTIVWALVVSILIAACLLIFRSVTLAALSGWLVLALYAGLTLLAFRSDLWMDALLPLSSGFLTLLMGGIAAYSNANRQKKVLRTAFSQYLSPDVVSRVTRHPELLRLGGEKRTMTAFFSDVRGFTSISEKLDPEHLVALLNLYLTRMTDVILSLKGTVDKFEGDAIIAFWGAPLDVPDHAVKACRSAWTCRELHTEMNRNLIEMGFPELHTRMGLNTGEMVVGNMGSERRFDYTIMGEAVNLASRLEGTNKLYGTTIMTTGVTVEACSGEFIFRELDTVRVVGQCRPVNLYELICPADAMDTATGNLLTAYAGALDLYRQGSFTEAATAFDLAGDGPAAAMASRCREFICTPPARTGDRWDGIYNLSSK
jgi:adenylate cyclase